MTVYKSKRKKTFLLFLQNSYNLRKETIRIIKKFPTSYRWIITNNMLKLAGEIFSDCLKANEIILTYQITEEDYNLKKNYLIQAASSTNALLGEITFCYELLKEGNNFFEDKSKFAKTFLHWTDLGNSTLEEIRAVLQNDRERFRKIQRRRVNKSESNNSLDIKENS